MDKYYTKTIRFSNATQCPFFKLVSLATFVAILAKFDLLLEPTTINIEGKQDLKKLKSKKCPIKSRSKTPILKDISVILTSRHGLKLGKLLRIRLD